MRQVAEETDSQNRPGKRGAKMVAAVHAATLALLEERGYERMEIPEVAVRAQVNKTSIYRRWPSKAELVLDVALSRMRIDVPVPDTGVLLRDLTALLQSIATTLATPLASVLLGTLISRGSQDAALQQARLAFWQERFEASGKLVAKAVSRGDLPPQTDARVLLEFAAAPLFFRVLATGEAVTKADMAGMAQRAIAAFAVAPV